ncbi:methionine gamma-lyase [Glaciecola sp. 1036]|uniref:methionine gamma-lyase n=1 Tax=Alteromonadaceae TaxID=72275 RepID=UPI003D0784B4
MSNHNKDYKFETRAIHHGYSSQENAGALNPPMHLSSTFTFESVQQGADLFSGQTQGHFYSRISNPTLSILEQRVANLEGAEAGLATASGIGAITATLWTLVKSGDEILVDSTIYGCTYAFLHHGLGKFGVNIRHVDMTDIHAIESTITPNTKVIYFETPANPNMRIVDIQRVCQLAQKYHVTTVVDNTYASPMLTQPVTMGADIVVHSATKYLGGHGDLIGGVLVGSKAMVERIRLEGLKDMTGACMSPFTAMLIMRGIKTLSLRMQRHSENANKVAQYLYQHPNVKHMTYPHHESFPQYALAKQQMRMGGGIITFEIAGDLHDAASFMNHLKLIQRAVSLGDAESLIQHPASMTHSTYSPEERAEHGISEGLIRLSVGLEDASDLIDDLQYALAKVSKINAA